MTCHPTDPNNPLPAGAKPVPEGTKPRECMGALTLVARELNCIQDHAGKLKDYRRASQNGLTKAGIDHWAWRLLTGSFPREFPVDDDIQRPDN